MYNLDLDRVVGEIRKNKAKKVLIQLPDGLKPRAETIVDYVEKHTKSRVFLWLGSCYGGCDIPNTGLLKFDLIIQFGHNKFVKEEL
ncbi:MAG: diphthamide synthesis protein [Candidatus Pacearchaeota archaeon]|jgi:2-(3-amino-3-carboxypropyl)histidine synthase